MLAKETQGLISKVVKNWDSIRSNFMVSKDDYGSGGTTKIGEIWWDNPKLIWILVTKKEENYEGSQSQVGIAKDGKLYWEFQSHCSCDDYEDTTDLPAPFIEDTLKCFNFTYTEPPLSWEKEMRENMIKLLA